MATAIARIPLDDRVRDDGRLLADAAALVGIGAWSCDLDTERLEWTDGVFELFGFERDRFLDRRAVVELYCEPYRDTLERMRSHAICTHTGFSMEARIRRPDGDMRWMRLAAKTAIANGRAVRLYGMKQDITAEKQQWDRLRRMAENDPLTGLANRARFHSEFLDLTPGSDVLAAIGALVLFDLDDFKRINDRWGHAAGDCYLARFAERLATAFPEAQLIARIGGDEFALLLPARLSPQAAEYLVRSRIDVLAAPVHVQDRVLPLGFSAGMAFNPQAKAIAPDSVFAAADMALYSAKRSGRAALRVAPADRGLA